MTAEELDAILDSIELAAPVEMADLAEIKRRIDERKAAGVCSEVVLRLEGVEILVGPLRRWLVVG